MNAFTCTGPYAMLILAGVKRVENRSAMPTLREGRCAISVSKRFSAKEYSNFIAWANKVFGLAWCMMNLQDWSEVREWRGQIVAVADYRAVDAIPEDESYAKQCRFWNEGYPNWWLLSNVKRLPTPIPCRGNVGMWQLDEETLERMGGLVGKLVVGGIGGPMETLRWDGLDG